MIQSMDCYFSGEEYGAGRGYRITDRSSNRSSRSKETERKNREKKESPSKNQKEKKRIGTLTTRWLKQNYCASPDVCLPREIVYERYLEFCKKERIPPACKATFGKLIRNTFPEVSSKRLGARGHSKYHYNGIGIKQSSEFRNANSTLQGVTRFSSVTSTSENPNLKKFCLSSKVGTLLPNFPDAEDLVIPLPEDKEKIATFLLMYKTHCQCILYLVISGNFEEIRVFLLHFWQGFPDHLMHLTRLNIFLDLVTICDSILYKTLLNVAIPSLTFEMPETLLQSLHNTGIRWNVWVQSSLENMPQKLIDTKMCTARSFCRSLKRCVALMHLAQVTRPILASDAPAHLFKELEYCLQEVWNYRWSSNAETGDNNKCDLTLKQARQLQNILNNCTSVELLIDALDKMLINVKGWKEKDKIETRNFVFNWVYMLSKISYILTENSSRCFTTFHLLSSLIQEYILLAVENQLDKEQEEHLHSRFRKHLKNSGNRTSNATFRSHEPCLRVNNRTSSDAKYIHKEDSGNLLDNTERTESNTMNGCYLYNTEIHPGTCIYYSRTETQSQPLPSCKYASGTYHNSTTYDYHLSSVGNHTDRRCVSGLSQQFSTAFLPSTAPSQTERASNPLNIPQLEIYPFEGISCNAKTYMKQHEPEINDNYQPFTTQQFQYLY